LVWQGVDLARVLRAGEMVGCGAAHPTDAEGGEWRISSALREISQKEHPQNNAKNPTLPTRAMVITQKRIEFFLIRARKSPDLVIIPKACGSLFASFQAVFRGTNPHPDPPHKGEGEERRLIPLKLFAFIRSADV